MDTAGFPLLHPDEKELDPAARLDDGSCLEYVPVYSNGIWDKQWEDMFRHSLLLLQFQLALIFILTSLIHYFLNRLHLPRMISDILAGLILGPTVMRRLSPRLSNFLFPSQSMKILLNLTRFGYLFFMFLIGVKMDVSLVSKSGKQAWIIGSMAVLIPLCGVGVAAVGMSVNNLDDYYTQEWVRQFSGITMITSFPVVACLLMHLKILNTELGRLALSSALISDLISVIIINTSNFQRIVTEASLRAGLVSMALCFTLVVFVVTVLRSLIYWIIRQTPEEKPVKSSHIFYIVTAVLLVEIVGDNVGLSFLYGPFLIGLTVPTGPPLASALVEKFDTMISGMFLPLVSFYCGYKSDLWALNRWPSKPIGFVTFFGMPVKLFSALVPAVCCKVPLKDALAIGLIMTAKGIVELGTLAMDVNTEPIDPGEFTMAVLIVLTVAAAVPLCVRELYDPSRVYTGYQERNILHNSSREALKILACAHRQDEATAAFKLLECCNSSRENPLCVYGLNLQELKGGSAPLLINHQLGQRMKSYKGSSFHPVIDVFNFLKVHHKGSVQVQVFTAISPLHLMDEDICWLAFDKSVSLIILPFNRKWNTNGKMVLDSSTLRTLNFNVLKKAPCSVGILIDRRSVRGATSILAQPSTYRVIMLHMGGEDDNETLALAKQMARCTSVHLTVIRFVALGSGDCRDNGWSKMLVDECLRDIKCNMSKHPNVEYKEEVVRDGVDTARIIQSIEQECDLIMVGRRHQVNSTVMFGLSEWCELLELGPIGDILTSSDISSSVSVLVVQQQIIDEK